MAEDWMVVYDPTAEPRAAGAELAPRPASLAGKTLGILDNGKANAGVLMQAIAEILRAEQGIAGTITRKKPVAGPAPAQAIEDLTRECVAVLVGSAD
jgi:hypothetical protein